jgi:hypothetical protein
VIVGLATESLHMRRKPGGSWEYHHWRNDCPQDLTTHRVGLEKLKGLRAGVREAQRVSLYGADGEGDGSKSDRPKVRRAGARPPSSH